MLCSITHVTNNFNAVIEKWWQGREERKGKARSWYPNMWGRSIGLTWGRTTPLNSFQVLCPPLLPSHAPFPGTHALPCKFLTKVLLRIKFNRQTSAEEQWLLSFKIKTFSSPRRSLSTEQSLKAKNSFLILTESSASRQKNVCRDPRSASLKWRGPILPAKSCSFPCSLSGIIGCLVTLLRCNFLMK